VTAPVTAAALGSARREGRDWRCRCPLHGGHSLVLADGRDGRLLVRCWGGGCDARDVLAELRRRGLIGCRSEDARPSPVTVPRSDDHADAARRCALARRIWDAARDARGSPVARYLAGRCITIPLSPSLRWAGSLRRPDGTTRPAVVARVDSLDGELIGVQRTWLDRDAGGTWKRRDRAMLGRAAGGAVRLAPATEMLLIAEGIETALAAMQATAQPAWAALSAFGVTALRLPPVVRRVIILADHDRSGAGERAAQTAAQRWRAEGRTVSVWISPYVDTDVNDLLRAEARRAA
jgi:putative DNA primase/helicase